MSGGTVVHASCVALGGRAALLLGPPGAGKSRLALELMALGAGLVADDATLLRREGDALIADAPPGAPAAIEARGVGLLPASLCGPAPVALAAELGAPATERLPPRRRTCLLGVPVPLLIAPTAAAVAQCLRCGPPLDPDAPTR
jgi:HPr kinase/phosphorylase